MTTHRTATRGPAPLALLLLAQAAASAEVPSGPPTFTDPTTFENVWFPFEENFYKVYRGKEEGEKITVIDRYSPDIRVFNWNGADVATRCLEEIEYEAGELVEISRNYFAEADDGTVYYFGEVVDNYEDGVITDHEGSWLVGGPGPGDPPETATATDPAVFMPANPEIGDTWKPEDVPAAGIDETVTVKNFKKVKTGMGKFTGALRVQEIHEDGGKEKKWYVQGLGFARAEAKKEKLVVVASSFAAEDDDD